MKTLRFIGHSDDTFGEYGLTNDDYDNCASGEGIEFLVHSEACNERLVVVGHYCNSDNNKGTWMIGLRQEEEEDDSAATVWPLRWTTEDYSMILEIDAPDDVVVAHIKATFNGHHTGTSTSRV